MDERTDGTRDRDGALSGPAADQAGSRGADAASAARERPAPRSPSDARAPALDKVDDASDDSFPASDAPAWTGMRVG